MPAAVTFTPRRPSPPRRRGHGPVRVALAIAGLGASAVVVWLAVGDHLVGGRWFAVHLFTLGVLSPLVLALSQHFAATLTRGDEGATTTMTLVFALGALGVLSGVPAGARWLLVTGATLAGGAVAIGYTRLRRLRIGATGARFGWIVRLYERAHGSFLHGAALGALLGAGVLTGDWYLPGRIAHLHATVLGWGGLTFLATVVFFGPTVLRRQIEPGADERAARQLRHGATGLSVAVLALLGTGIGGATGTGLRLVAAAGVGVLAWVATTTCAPVVRTALRGSPGPSRWPMAAACTWLPVGLWLDVLVVATGAWRWLDVLGAIALLGVLLQAVLASVLHLGPVAMARGRTHRDHVRARVAAGSGARALALEVGVVLVVGSAALPPARLVLPFGDGAGRVGWALVVAAVVSVVVATLSGLRPARE